MNSQQGPSIVEATIWLSAATVRQPRIAPLRNGVGAGRFQHSEWAALLGRFVQPAGVDYGGLRRVQRLVEVYLSRLAAANPETFADADDQLALYLNAYNAIAIHQILLHGTAHTIRAIPSAFTRPYPIGRRNLSLHTLHGGILRAFGDPRIHAAISPAARGGALLQPEPFTGTQLQAMLDGALRRLLADETHGARLDAASGTLYLSPLVRWCGGDFVQPERMPGVSHLLGAAWQPGKLVEALRPFLPPALSAALPPQPRLAVLPFDWALNIASVPASGRALHML